MAFIPEIFTNLILPFLLIFVLVFAILQKSKILGDGKAQIDALIAMVIGLLLVGLPGPRDIVVNLMPWLAVGVSVILVFLILYGFVAGDLSSTPKWMKITFGTLAGLFVVGVVLYVTGLWEPIYDALFGSAKTEIFSSILLVVIIVAAFVIAVATGKKGGSSSSSSD